MFRRILIHALIISDTDGNFLVHLIRNGELDEALLSGFIAALNMFGKQTIGDLNEISLSGLDISLLVVSKYNLICIAVMDADLTELDFREGCENALDVFYERYKDELDNWGGNIAKFRDFRAFLDGQIQDYFVKIKAFRKQQRMKYKERDSDCLSAEDLIKSLEKQLNSYENTIEKLEADNKKLKEILNIPDELERPRKKIRKD